MGGVQRQYSEREQAEITQAYESSKQAEEAKRYQCMRLRAVFGKSSREIAELTGCAEGHVRNIISRYHQKGIEGLRSGKRGGRRRRMSVEDEASFLEAFQKEAEAGRTLEVSRIHQALEERLGGKVALGTVYNMLHRQGWRKVMPRSKHPKKASEEEISSFKKNQ